MVYILLFLAELIFLFFISRSLTSLMSSFLLGITKSKNATINILSFLFLPGVIIHELSHAIFAGILFVRVGEIEFTPKIIKGTKSEGVKLGSVAIAKTDPVRRMIIGTAPVFTGLAILLMIVYSLVNNNLAILSIPAIKILLFYLIFAISNTMFSSKKDMEGALEFILVAVLILTFLYLVGVRLPLDFLTSNLLSEEALGFMKKADLFISAPLALDVVIYLALKGLSRLRA